DDFLHRAPHDPGCGFVHGKVAPFAVLGDDHVGAAVEDGREKRMGAAPLSLDFLAFADIVKKCRKPAILDGAGSNAVPALAGLVPYFEFHGHAVPNCSEIGLFHDGPAPGGEQLPAASPQHLATGQAEYPFRCPVEARNAPFAVKSAKSVDDPFEDIDGWRPGSRRLRGLPAWFGEFQDGLFSGPGVAGALAAI